MKYKIYISILFIILSIPIVFVVLYISSQAWFIGSQTIEGRDFIERFFTSSRSTYKYQCEDFPDFEQISNILEEKEGGQFSRLEAYLEEIDYMYKLEPHAVDRCPGKYEFVVFAKNKAERDRINNILEGYGLNGVPVNIVGI